MDPPDRDRPGGVHWHHAACASSWSQHPQKIARYFEVRDVRGSGVGLLARRWKFDDEVGPRAETV
jgi:hypothetical protein